MTEPDVKMPPSPAVEEMKAHPASIESNSADEPKPHLHAKTFLAVFAVCSIYFAQLVTLVGAGAVSCP